MGILNVTPDSFAEAAPRLDTGAAIEAAERMQSDGADLIDVGGESTRPGADPVTADEELARVIPVITGLARRLRIPLSVDTYKADVARAAIDAGAAIVNDISGLQYDPPLARVVAERGAALVLMHNGFRAEDGTHSSSEASHLSDIIRDLRAQIEAASEAGVQMDRLIVDPGVGFGKSVSQNLEILDRLREFKSLGLPILIGPSRKGFISRTLDVPVNEREEGTAAAVALGIANGADLVRVHDVKGMARVAKMTDAIVRKNVTGDR
jgi:dihydropteroate synthase